MEVFKLRIKIGANELEAEGSQEYVESERDIFLRSIGAYGSKGDEEEKLAEQPEMTSPSAGGNGQPLTDSRLLMSLAEVQKIAHQDGDRITLTALPTGKTAEQDALILLLLAHKVMRNLDSVPADDVLGGLRQSGITVDRLDRIASRIPALVISTGVRRGTKYRLTNPGFAKAKEVATALIGTLV